MTAKQVSVGLTYSVKFGDEFQPVTLTKDCPWGGWYGRNEMTGDTVRIATAGRLNSQVNGTAIREAVNTRKTTGNIVHIDTKEATMPTSTPEARTARSNRRKPAAKQAANTPPTLTYTDTKESTVTTKPAAKSKPAAKRKPAAKNKPVVKLSGAVTEEAKQATLLTQDQANEMVAAAVAAAMAEFTAAATPAAKPTARKRKPAAKPETVTVKLKANAPKQTSYQFKYVGKDDNPLVTAVYVKLPLLEQFAEDGDAIDIFFTAYSPVGQQKPQPKSKIRYTGSDDTIRDLYVDRAGITALGYSESKPPVVTVEVIGSEEIALTFTAA